MEDRYCRESYSLLCSVRCDGYPVPRDLLTEPFLQSSALPVRAHEAGTVRRRHGERNHGLRKTPIRLKAGKTQEMLSRKHAGAPSEIRVFPDKTLANSQTIFRTLPGNGRISYLDFCASPVHVPSIST